MSSFLREIRESWETSAGAVLLKGPAVVKNSVMAICMHLRPPGKTGATCGFSVLLP